MDIVMTDREAMKLALEAISALLYNDMNRVEIAMNAIAALRQALDHVPDTTKMIEPDMGIDRGAWDDVPDATKWVDELRGGDETEQEPVAWWNPRYGKGEYAFAEEQSPPDDSNDPSDFGWNIPLYTAPPKREWVGLTDEDIAEGAEQSWVDKQAFESAVWWAEEKLRKKNGY